MKCIKCQGEIPEGSELCLRCGTRQNLHINRRPPLQSTGLSRQRKRSLFLVFVLILIIVAAFFIIGYSRDASKNSEFDTIVATYEKKDLERLNYQVSHFVKNYPDDPLAITAKDYLDLLNDELNRPPGGEPDELEKYFELLDADPAGMLLTVDSLSLSHLEGRGTYGVDIGWSYNFDKEITDLSFIVEAFDAKGNPVVCEDKGVSKVRLLVSDISHNRGDKVELRFPNAWMTSHVASVKLLQVNISFADNFDYIVSPNNISKIITYTNK